RLVIALLLALLCSCGQPDEPAATGNSLQGTITVSGAWALYPMMVRWGEVFQAQHPDVVFNISAGGAGKGMADALADAVDIGMVSRAVYAEEVARGAFAVAVAKDAVFLTVNAANPVWAELATQGVTREMLIGIYISGEVTNWGQVVGRPEVTEPIHIFTRSDAAGAPATWAEYLGQKQEDLLGVGVYGDPGLLDAVAKDPLGIGYNNLNYAFDMDTGLPVAGTRVVPLDGDGNGRITPDEQLDTKAQAVQAVAANVYPSPPARDLNLVMHGAPAELVHAFLVWILTDGQAYLEEAGYVALPAAQLAAELAKLEP
ncbi:MAG: substrate-binding domain-containing protein, partial [Anaerolineales bacterium]|nr:substrate-binding domain-containing protein [Anaerolineales bacterium]